MDEAIAELTRKVDALTAQVQYLTKQAQATERERQARAELMKRKSYFVFLKGGLRTVDNIVTSFTEEDVRQLGDNIVLILRTVKEMTQPEVMNFLRNTVTLTEQEAEAPVDISYRALLAQMRDPNVRRGLALTMRMLRSVGAQTPNPN